MLATFTPGMDRAYTCGWLEGLVKFILSPLGFVQVWDWFVLMWDALSGSPTTMRGYLGCDQIGWDVETIESARILAILLAVAIGIFLVVAIVVSIRNRHLIGSKLSAYGASVKGYFGGDPEENAEPVDA